MIYKENKVDNVIESIRNSESVFEDPEILMKKLTSNIDERMVST